MIKRDDALQALSKFVNEDDLVVAVYQTCFDWLALHPRDLNYVSVGAMGQASSHALGLAIGSPDRQVIVLDGDGSLLMNLGSLVTIGEIHPKKFLHLVFENGVYEVNGDHPIPGQGNVNFAGMAKSAGYKIALISGRYSPATEYRAKELRIEDVYNGGLNKIHAYEELKTKYNIIDSEIAYVGDDLIDISVMKKVGAPIAVSNAISNVKEIAIYTTKTVGGHGAFREAVSWIIDQQGRTKEVLKIMESKILNS